MTRWIRNPIEWGADQLRWGVVSIESAGRALAHIPETLHSPSPIVRRIRSTDVWSALVEGASDFVACRTDVIFLCAFYPLVGVVLTKVVVGSGLLHLLFPIAAGFALIGPFASIGLMEMSKRREQGEPVSASTPLRVLQAPGFPSIVLLGLALTTIFLLWIAAADLIFRLTIGTEPQGSIGSFLSSVFETRDGVALICAGLFVGFVFALVVLTISVVSFALLLDCDAGIDTAVKTSIRAVMINPVPVAVWGLCVASGLALGSLPFFLGLIVVFPILGHASWRLYRKIIVGP